MILQALKEYGDSVKPPDEQGVVSDAFDDDVSIHWLLEIDGEGGFVNLHYRGIEQRDEKGRKKPDRFEPLHRVPKEVTNSRSSGGNPQFLADNLEYYFGISDSNLGSKNRDSHIARVKEFAAAFPNDSRAQAIKKFFDTLAAGKIQVEWDENPPRGSGKLIVKHAAGEQRFAVKKPKERMAVCVKEDNLLPAFQACTNVRVFWSRHFAAINAERQKPAKAGNVPPCICCGQPKPAVSTFDQFDGLPGGKTYLICYGKDAFHSYGFEDGENASLCFDCMKAAVRGIEALLKNPATHYLLRDGTPKPDEAEKIAPVIFAFWSKEPTEFNFEKISDADPQSVKELFLSVRRGLPKEIAERKFYILGFSRSSKLRTLIRYWSETNIKDVVQNLAAWFDGLRDRFEEYGPNNKPLPLIRLCRMTVRQPGQTGDEWKFPPVVSTGLFLSAFLGKPVPPPVLQMLINRVRIIPQTEFDKEKPNADYKLKPARMALLRLTLNRLMKNNEQPFDVGLDVDRREPEYHCGRLLAVCDDAMHWAAGKSTVADRYMGSASSAPCSVLPVVYRNSRHHLNKLKRDIPPKATQLEKILDEILSKLKEYPATLTPKKAGIFILGFHHQRQYFFLLMRYRKLLKKRQEQGTLDAADQKELEALEDYKNRTHFDVSLLADLPDEEMLESSTAESE